MREAFICDGIRTPIGRYGGALSGVRADDLLFIFCCKPDFISSENCIFHRSHIM